MCMICVAFEISKLCEVVENDISLDHLRFMLEKNNEVCSKMETPLLEIVTTAILKALVDYKSALEMQSRVN